MSPGFAEVPESLVRRKIRAAVAERLRIVVVDLGLPPLRVRWFKWTPRAPEWNRQADLALTVLNVDPRARTLGGKALAIPLPMIWLRASLHQDTAVHVAAHEARHVWQQLHWKKEDDHRLDMEFAERDAEEYADRFLGLNSRAVERRRPARASLAGGFGPSSFAR